MLGGARGRWAEVGPAQMGAGQADPGPVGMLQQYWRDTLQKAMVRSWGLSEKSVCLRVLSSELLLHTYHLAPAH